MPKNHTHTFMRRLTSTPIRANIFLGSRSWMTALKCGPVTHLARTQSAVPNAEELKILS